MGHALGDVFHAIEVNGAGTRIVEDHSPLSHDFALETDREHIVVIGQQHVVLAAFQPSANSCPCAAIHTPVPERK